MDTLVRVREASVKVAKIQRRLWLIQTVFWPVLAVVGVVVAAVAARSVWRRFSATPVRREVDSVTDVPAAAGIDRPVHG